MHTHALFRAVVNLVEQEDADAEIHRLAIQTLGRLCKYLNFSDYASRIIHPIVRLLDQVRFLAIYFVHLLASVSFRFVSFVVAVLLGCWFLTVSVLFPVLINLFFPFFPVLHFSHQPAPDPKDKQQSSAVFDLRKEVFETLCALLLQLGSDFAIFIPMLHRVMSKNNISDTRYETLISRLMKNQPLHDDPELRGLNERRNSEGSWSQCCMFVSFVRFFVCYSCASLFVLLVFFFIHVSFFSQCVLFSSNFDASSPFVCGFFRGNATHTQPSVCLSALGGCEQTENQQGPSQAVLGGNTALHKRRLGRVDEKVCNRMML